MCASIAGVAVPICTHLFGHTEYSSFLGTMIGFVGTEKKFASFYLNSLIGELKKMTMMISEVTFNKIFPHAVKGVYQAISAQIEKSRLCE